MLSGFALAQPLLDILSKNPEFFAIRGSTSTQIVLFALFIVFVPPAVLLAVELLVAIFSRRAAGIVHLVFVAGLVAVVVLHALTNDSRLTGVTSLVVAAAAGIGGAVLYARAAVARSFLTVLTPAPFIFLALFFSSSGIEKLVFPKTPPRVKKEHVSSRTPVVLIVFDEFAPVSLMDRSEDVDEARYPNFARLANTSTWYRSATTVQWLTEVAVPAIFTGILPPPHKKLLPIYLDHPNNIFTLLGGSYKVEGVESLTHMCPASICKGVKGSAAQEVKGTSGSLANDASVVYLHLVLPSPYVGSVPQISDSWGNFGQPEHSEVSTAHGPVLPCARNVCRFASTFHRSGGTPTAYILHSLLPHVPYLYLPSAKAYGIEVPILRGVRHGVWQQPWPSLQSYQRFLLQTEYTDRALGYMMQKLKAKGIFDKALVIVLADHGVSFRHQQPRRLPTTPGNMQDIAFVPLFVKLPHQYRGRVDDGLARTVDVVPTIAKVLHVKIPYRVDGKPLVGRRLPQDGTVRILIGNGRYVNARLSDLQALRRQALGEQLAAFGTTPADLYRIGPHQELLGRLVSGLSIHPSKSTSVQLSNESLLRTVDTHSGLLPTWIQGQVSGPLAGQDLAVAVNGRVAAMTQTFEAGGATRFTAMVPEGSLHDGRNDVSVFAVQPGGTLEELRGSSVTTTLKTRGGVQVIVSSGGKAIPVRPQTLAGDVKVKPGATFDFDGSASDAARRHKVEGVQVFVDGEEVYASRSSLIQPKSMLGQVAKQNPYGFQFGLPASLLPKPGSGHTVRVFAVRGGAAGELRYLGAWPWGH